MREMADEPRRLRTAVAQVERRRGAKTGTDQPIGVSFRLIRRRGPMDCIDGMVNSGT